MPDLPPPTPDVEVVVVTAPRLAPLGGEAAFSAVRIEAADLARVGRLDEALKQAPGVSLFRRTGSGAANPTTQGLSLRAIAPSGAGRALVTLDGAPVNDPFGGWVIWSALPSEALDGATIVRGAGSGPYGAGALTGVVALSERGTPEGIGAAEVSVGQRDSLRAAVVAGVGGFMVVASGSRSDGYHPVRGARQGAADTRLRLDDASLALRWQGEVAGARGAVRLAAYQANQQAGLIGARSNATGLSATATLAQPAADGVGGWRLQGWVRTSDLENSSVAVAANRATTTPANDQYDTPATGWGANAAWQGLNGPVAWEVGADLRAADGETRERFRFLAGAFTRDRVAGGKTLSLGAYAEGVWTEGPLTLTGGARLDRTRAWDALRQERDRATGALTLDQRPAGRSDTTPTGRLGARYAWSEAIHVRGAAYAGFRPPTLNELHRPFRVGNDITEANAALKPETLQGLEVGIGGADVVSWSAGLFWNRLKDPVTNVTIGVGPGTFPTAGFIPAGGVLRQRRNAGEIEAWGVEAEAFGGGEAVRWRGALSYADAEVNGGVAAPQLTGKRPAQTPRWTATAGLIVTPTPAFEIAADARYESARFEDDLNTRRLSAGAQVDVRATWRAAPGVAWWVAAENLTNARLEAGETADGVESYAAPRTLRLGLTFRPQGAR
jgi:vitamin B12 transporter